MLFREASTWGFVYCLRFVFVLFSAFCSALLLFLNRCIIIIFIGREYGSSYSDFPFRSACNVIPRFISNKFLSKEMKMRMSSSIYSLLFRWMQFISSENCDIYRERPKRYGGEIWKQMRNCKSEWKCSKRKRGTQTQRKQTNERETKTEENKTTTNNNNKHSTPSPSQKSSLPPSQTSWAKMFYVDLMDAALGGGGEEEEEEEDEEEATIEDDTTPTPPDFQRWGEKLVSKGGWGVSDQLPDRKFAKFFVNLNLHL